MAQLKKTAAQLVKEARARIDEVSTEWLLDHHGDEDIVIIDIRDIRELQKLGKIPQAHHAPRGMLEFWVDPQSPYYREIFGREGKHYILHCASGWRSALATAALQDMGFQASHLADGFNDWVAKDGPILDMSTKP